MRILVILLLCSAHALADPIVDGTPIRWDYAPPYTYTDGTSAEMSHYEVDLRSSRTTRLDTFTIPISDTEFQFGDTAYAPAALWEDTRYIYLRAVSVSLEFSAYVILGPVNDPVTIGGGGGVIDPPVIIAPTGGDVVYTGPRARLEWTHPGTDQGSGLLEFQLQFLDDKGTIVKQYNLPPEARYMELNTVSQHARIYDARIRAMDEVGNASPWTEFAGVLRIDREAPPAIPSLDVVHE